MAALSRFILLYTLASLASADTVILQLEVVEGEGAIHTAGSRSTRPLTIQVTDETGQPVAGAAVSFQLPEDALGVFRSGLKSDVLVTGADGKVSEWGIQWGNASGPVRIRVTAAKDQARAGAIVAQYVSDSQPAPAAAIGKSRPRWKLWAALAAGAAGGGLAIGLTSSKNSPPAGAGAVLAQPVQVGTPVIAIGKP